MHLCLPLCCMLKRRWWPNRHTAAGREGFAPTSATLLHVDPALAAPALAAPALAAPALWAEEKVSAIGLYGCTNQITTRKHLFVVRSGMWISCLAATALSHPRPPSFPSRCREPGMSLPWLRR